MNKIYGTLAAWILVLCGNAEGIVIHNNTDQKVYCAFYYQSLKSKMPYSSAKLKRKGDYDSIAPHGSEHIDAPGFKAGFERKLVCVFEKDVPTKKDREDYFQDKEKKKRFVDIGSVSAIEGDIGNDYWVDTDEHRIKINDAFQKKVYQPVKQDVKEFIPRSVEDLILPVYVGKVIAKEIAQDMRKELNKTNPYKETKATVRVSNDLCPEEQAYNQKRISRVKAAIEQFTDMTINSDDEIPKIAMIASGGGYRAMICGLGFFAGAEKIGLTDMAMWVVGLSGGTWAIGNWYVNGKTVAQARDILLPKLTKDLPNITNEERKKITESVWIKYAFDEPITFVDIYGGLLANRFFDHYGSKRHKVHLSEQRNVVQDGDRPLPIYTAVTPIDTKKKIEFLGKEIYEWFEFTPYEIGSAWLGCYVPSWGYGREFDFGVSKDFAPEQSFGFLLGTFGSAFAASFKILEQEVGLGGFGDFLATQNLPASHAEVFNFTRGIRKSALSNHKQLKLVDAGLDFNLPYPPISGERPERKADIIIVFDSSLTVLDEFKKMEKYAKNRNLPYPKVNYSTDFTQDSIAVCEDDEVDTPIIIYMPRVNDFALWNEKKKDPAFKNEYNMYEKVDLNKCMKFECATDNFQYKYQQSYNITKVTECNVVMNEDVIREAIKRWIEFKRNQKK